MKTSLLKLFILAGITMLASCQINENLNDFSSRTIINLLQLNFDGYTTEGLDFGLYWFDENHNSTPAFDMQTQVQRQVGSSFYDASKPTVIFFHGWQPLTNGGRNDFLFEDDALSMQINTAEQWKRDGWNVAIFYWNQFADELEVKHAEAKIWSSEGPRGMRYKKADGSYMESNFDISLTEIAFHQLNQILPANTSNNIRFVGHSLGCQLATAIAYKFSKENPIALKRLELLDPFWSRGGKSYLSDYNKVGQDDFVGEVSRWYVKEMITKDNLAVTWYRTSGIADLGIGDKNRPMEELVALVNMRFWYLNGLQIPDKHVYSRHHYFFSKSFEAPVECTISWWNRSKTGNVAASANTTDQRIREMMGNRYHWDQVEGRYTVTPEDDWFERKSY
ncbi:cell adhesion protein [Flammeovirga aprica]|uniref:Cell adhesion protein n=1 Tax=Flammeovirga aprica JL-4 TaxID=694437 RepID=A0A7X9RUS2_9BACT|nr:cell adhesion protein [Flammeovirga aprica]NME69095.1 cell adhesion protein [Flammeovirga aprica JL-4]